VCKSSTEPGGPRRCSADARHTLQRSSAEVAGYEHLLDNTQGHAICAADRFADWRPDGPGSAEDLNRAYRTDIKISPVYAATQFARAVLQPGRAVIVDTETVSMGGPVCEISVISAHDGQVLLNTLVNPQAPIVPAAQAVHGISEDEVSAPGVPTWAHIYSMFEQVTHDRVILAYNSDYDRGVIESDCARYNIPSAHISTHRLRWVDVMMPRTHYAQSRKWMKNDGGHRALGDVVQTRNHLLEMARGDALAGVQPRPPMTQADFAALITRTAIPDIREAG
jgi:DNA polymerase-3 subunit epsilon